MVHNGGACQEQCESQNKRAWLQVALCHLINFNSFGYALSFGVFQTYYAKELGIASSEASWIGTLQLFFLFFLGAFSGRAIDAGFHRQTLLLGQSCQVVAIFATSFCSKYHELLLAQGVLHGLGNGLLFAPAIALVCAYFPPNKRAVPLSLLACGGATGGMVFPAMARQLLPRVGFPWTTRCMGFVIFSTHVVVFLWSRPSIKSASRGRQSLKLLDPTVIRDAPYLLFCLGIFLTFWGLFFVYFYARSYAIDVLNMSEQSSFMLILLVNGAGIPGRIVPNILADRYFGALNVQIPVVSITGLLMLCWIAVKTVASYYVWVVFYGFFGGGCQSLFQAAASSFSNNENTLGIRIGLACTVVSFASLSGSPIAGSLIQHTSGNYLGAQTFAGVAMMLGGILLAASRISQKRELPTPS